MALVYYLGPSGGTGGGVVDPRDPSHQPAQIDFTPTITGFRTVNDVFAKDDCRISEMIINSGLDIDSITVSYVGDTADMAYGSYKMGGNGGGEHIIQLAKGEYLTRIIGEYSDVVKNLQYWTSRGVSGALGTSGAVNFDYQAPAGYQIIGFWGGSGAYIDRIGVAIRTV